MGQLNGKLKLTAEEFVKRRRARDQRRAIEEFRKGFQNALCHTLQKGKQDSNGRD